MRIIRANRRPTAKTHWVSEVKEPEKERQRHSSPFISDYRQTDRQSSVLCAFATSALNITFVSKVVARVREPHSSDLSTTCRCTLLAGRDSTPLPPTRRPFLNIINNLPRSSDDRTSHRHLIQQVAFERHIEHEYIQLGRLPYPLGERKISWGLHRARRLRKDSGV